MEADAFRVRIQKYCAYQERAHSEVRKKLRELGCSEEDADQLIVDLIQDNFLNEERFARAFARGKYSIKRWGRNKIREALKQKEIGDRLVGRALEEEIEQEQYLQNLYHLAQRKRSAANFDELTEFEQKETVRKYLLSRGYEWEIVRKEVEENWKEMEPY